MAVGSRDKGSDGRHNKAELYSHSTLSWKTKTSYPFHWTIQAFEILAESDSFILFGGLYPYQRADLSTGFYETDIIAKFNPGSNKWTKLGNLQTRRHAFSVIEIKTKYLVMGGQENKNTETCELINEKIQCTSRESILNDFHYYPALMIVASDYAENC